MKQNILVIPAPFGKIRKPNIIGRHLQEEAFLKASVLNSHVHVHRTDFGLRGGKAREYSGNVEPFFVSSSSRFIGDG